jgi:transcriptional regulator with XRE-family HTH domain
MDDQRVGAAYRRLRIRRHLRQADLAALAAVPRKVVMAVEAGRLENVTVGSLRSIARALDGRFEGTLLWRGDGLDRLMNRGHASLHEAVARWLRDVGGWVALPEISFARDGERGVIDILAWHPATRSLLVIELKTRLVDISSLMATMDVRRRVAWSIARGHGWEPATVSIWVVLAPARTNQRILAEHRTVLRTKFPADGRSIRRWLAAPGSPIAALSFLPQVRVRDLGQAMATPRRVRAPNGGLAEHGAASDRPPEPRVGVTFCA